MYAATSADYEPRLVRKFSRLRTHEPTGQRAADPIKITT